MKFRAKPRKHRWKHLLWLLPLLILLSGWLFYQSKLSLVNYDDGTVSSEGIIDDDDSEVQADSAAMEEALKDLEETDAVLAEGDVFADSDVFNVLLIGTDDRTREFNANARGDTCMLASINKEAMQVTLVSFERGMGVPILSGSYQGQYDWLTHTFRYGGADLMMREIQECFKVDVTHYVRVNIYTFMQLVDSIGGVDIELTEAEANYINHPEGTYGAGHIREMGIADLVQNVSVGTNHLNGATAMLYARCRYIDNDWQRVQRQRNVLTASIEQAKQMNLLELNSMLDTILPMVQTNLTEKEITSLLPLLARVGDIQIQQLTVPASGTYGSMTGMGGRKMFAVDFVKNAEILQEILYGSNAE